jgi:hypothetical protein
MPATYDKLGVRFQYPDNWVLDEKDALAGEDSVSVYSPGGAFWTLAIHTPDMRPRDLADAAVKAMRQVYEEIDSERVRETIAGHKLIGYDLNFYCLDLTNTAQVRVARTPRASFVVFCQADDREFAEIEPVFRAITASLLSGAGRPSEASS